MDEIKQDAAASPGLESPVPRERAEPSLSVAVREQTDILRRRIAKTLVVICLLGVILAAAGVVWTRTKNASGSSSLAIRKSVAVMEFKSASSNPTTAWLSFALSDMFRTELAMTDGLRVVPGEDVSRMKLELGLPAEDSLSTDTLARIRRIIAADFVLLGSFASLPNGKEDQIRLDIKLQDTVTGEIIAAVSQTGSLSALLTLIPAAAGDIRKALGVREGSDSKPAERRSASILNPEALRFYFEGLQTLRLLDAKTALPLLDKAAVLQPRSALIHSAIAEAWATLGYQNRARDEARKAFELGTDLAQPEKLQLEARFLALQLQWDRTIDIYRSLFMVFPDSLEFGLRLVEAQTAGGKAKDALATIAALRSMPALAADDPRIDLGEAATWEALGGFKQERTAAERAAQKAEMMGARLLFANALLRDCWASNNLGERERAVEAARKARELFAATGDPGGEARALKNIADVLDDSGDHAQAQKYYNEALKLFRRIGHERGAALTLNNLAYAVGSRGDLLEAKRMFNASLDLGRKIGDESVEALAVNGIAVLLWRQDDLAGAEKAYKKALDIHLRRHDLSRAATVLGNLGIVQQDQGHLSEAKSTFEHSLKLLREVGDKPGVARTVGNLGELMLRQGELEKAKERFLEQLTLGRAIPEDKQRGYALHGLGAVLLAEGDINGARSKLEEALALRLGMGAKGLAAETRAAIAQVAFEEGNFPQAEQFSREAAEEFRRERETDQEIWIRALLARCLIAQRKVAQAKEVLNRVRTGLLNIDDVAIRISTSIAVARSVAGLGNTNEARKVLQKTRSEAANGGYVLLDFESRLASAEIDSSPAVRAQLEALEKEARAKKLGLISRKALNRLSGLGSSSQR